MKSSLVRTHPPRTSLSCNSGDTPSIKARLVQGIVEPRRRGNLGDYCLRCPEVCGYGFTCKFAQASHGSVRSENPMARTGPPLNFYGGSGALLKLRDQMASRTQRRCFLLEFGWHFLCSRGAQCCHTYLLEQDRNGRALGWPIHGKPGGDRVLCARPQT